MPWTTLAKAKKAGAITNFRKKPLSIAAINKLYEIYDSIKVKGKVDNPMAVAMSTWKSLVVLKKGQWVLKPVSKKESKKQKVESSALGGYEVPLPVTSFSTPVGFAKIGDGSFETFKDVLKNALQALLGKKYLYIIYTYKTKVVVDVDEGTKSGYYEVPYKIKDSKFTFGTPVRVVKLTKFQKAEQKAFEDYRESVKKLVAGKGTLAETVKLATKVSRVKIA